MMKYIALYLLLINAAAFILMLVDKFKAKRGLWRIPEKPFGRTIISRGPRETP